MRTARVVASDPIAEARIALDSARAATAAARATLREAEAAKSAAIDDAPDDVVAGAVGRCMKADRAVTKCETEEATALAALEAVERARDAKALEAKIAFVEAMPARVLPIVEKLTALRAQAWTARQELAALVVAAQDAHDVASSLGERLNKPNEVARRVARPKMSELLLLVQVAHALDDDRLDREDPCDVMRAASLSTPWDSPHRGAIDAAVATLKGTRK